MALPFGVRQRPQLVEMPPQRMAVVRTVGDPESAAGRAFPALFKCVFTLKFGPLKERGVEYRVGAPRARWPGGPGGLELSREEWVALWGIPVPDEVDELPQPVPDVPVELQTWEYGLVAHVLHLGAYADELPTIEMLHAFILESGCEIAGDHEEEYLSRPTAKTPKTIIRYPVRRLGSVEAGGPHG